MKILRSILLIGTGVILSQVATEVNKYMNDQDTKLGGVLDSIGDAVKKLVDHFKQALADAKASCPEVIDVSDDIKKGNDIVDSINQILSDAQPVATAPADGGSGNEAGAGADEGSQETAPVVSAPSSDVPETPVESAPAEPSVPAEADRTDAPTPATVIAEQASEDSGDGE